MQDTCRIHAEYIRIRIVYETPPNLYRKHPVTPLRCARARALNHAPLHEVKCTLRA